MIQDGALVDKIKRINGKKIFMDKMGGQDLKFFQELMKHKIRIPDHQHVEQTNKWKGDIMSIEEMFRYVYSDRFISGWSQTFYKVLKLDVFGQVGQEVLQLLRPSVAEVEEYRKRCGRTGYPLLQCLEAKHKNKYQALGKLEFLFDVYPKSQTPKIQTTTPSGDCSNLRNACDGPIRSVRAETLIEEMEDTERILIYTSENIKDQVATCLANAAVDKEYVCIRKQFPGEEEIRDRMERTYEKEHYFIEHGLDEYPKLDMSDSSYGQCPKELRKQCQYNYDYEAPRTYHHLQVDSAQKKCLVIVEDCDRIHKNQKINQSGKPSDYLGNVIGRLRFTKARVIIISCKSKSSPAKNFQCNLPDWYASVMEQSDRH